MQQWGSQAEGDRPVPGDYDGSQNADVAIFACSDGPWRITKSGRWIKGTAAVERAARSATFRCRAITEGTNAMNLAVWRASTGEWWVLQERREPLVTAVG